VIGCMIISLYIINIIIAILSYWLHSVSGVISNVSGHRKRTGLQCGQLDLNISDN